MKVFISHSHESQALAKQISDALRRVGLEVWDDTQILPGDNWAQEIARALERCAKILASGRYCYCRADTDRWDFLCEIPLESARSLSIFNISESSVKLKGIFLHLPSVWPKREQIP